MTNGEIGLTATVVVFVFILLIMLGVGAYYNSRPASPGKTIVEYVFIDRYNNDGSTPAADGSGSSSSGGGAAPPAAKQTASMAPPRARGARRLDGDGSAPAGDGTVKEVGSDDAAMEKLRDTSVPTILFLYMDGCGFCEKAKPDMSELASEFPDVQVLSLNARNGQKIARANDINGFPAFLSNFGSQRRMVGYKPKDAMARVMHAGRASRGLVVSPVAAAAAARGARLVVSPVQAGGAGAPDVTEKEAMDLLANDASPAIVFVYATWCGFCNKMKPVYDAAVAQYPNVKMVKLDAATAPMFVKQHKIAGFPTFIMNFGSKQESGYKSAEAFASSVMSQAASAGGGRM
jgi:thioredoxin 1